MEVSGSVSQRTGWGLLSILLPLARVLLQARTVGSRSTNTDTEKWQRRSDVLQLQVHHRQAAWPSLLTNCKWQQRDCVEGAFASSLLKETHGVSLEGMSLLPAKVCPQDQPCPLRQLQACRHGCRVVLRIIWKAIFLGMPRCAGEPACTAVSWTAGGQQANGKKQSLSFSVLQHAVSQRRRRSPAFQPQQSLPMRNASQDHFEDQIYKVWPVKKQNALLDLNGQGECSHLLIYLQCGGLL